MSVEFSVPLSQIAEALNLTEVYVAENYKETNISTVEINRPGLELTGYLEFFDNKRIQVLGNTEFSYLGRYGPEAQKMVIDSIFSFGPPAVIICRDIEPSNAILESAKLHKVSIFSTPQSTSDLTASLVQYLNKELAPRITRHGVLVEVYGEGCLLTGDSGVGKSETAIELIKRGHRLVSDDVVELRKVSDVTLVGSAPDITRHFIELRGIGIIDVKTLFGVESVKDTQSVDLVIKLEEWDRDKEYDRLGLHEEYTEYLGNKIVCHSLPIRPGRNLAVIVESAAVNHRQKKMGYNAAEELYKRVQANIAKKREE